MCGITGLYSRVGIKNHLESIQKANNEIVYRGPDGSGYVFFKKNYFKTFFQHDEENIKNEIDQNYFLGFGHRRLSIIDLTDKGSQPMSINGSNYWIVYNGEIYNHVEIKKYLQKKGYKFQSNCDTEVILHSYVEWGENCVEKFNGMWAFTIYDRKKNFLFCSRDRFGIKPFHYFKNNDFFVFSSEIKQLLNFKFVNKAINNSSVFDYLNFGGIEHSKYTFFENIIKLEPGNNILYNLNENTFKIKKYYNPTLETDFSLNYKKASQEFKSLLFDSVKLRLRSDVEVGSCLSGGIDSSSIVSIIKNLNKNQTNNSQHSFSSHFNDEEANELEYMKCIIDHSNVKSHFTYPNEEKLMKDLNDLIWHQEEPFASTSIFAQWEVFKKVKSGNIKVMLDGQGADEMLAGYLGLRYYFFNELKEERNFKKLFFEKVLYQYMYSSNKNILNFLNILFKKFVNKKINNEVEFVNSINKDFYNSQIKNSIFSKNQSFQNYQEKEKLNNVLYQLTFKNNLPGLLKYEDRNSMAFSVEARVPFLDYRLIEFIMKLPSNFKIRNGYTKSILRSSVKGVIPNKIRLRTAKLGFATPEKKWQAGILKNLVNDAILDKRLEQYIDPKLAKKRYQDITNYSLSDSSPWRWVNLMLWMNIYDLS